MKNLFRTRQEEHSKAAATIKKAERLLMDQRPLLLYHTFLKYYYIDKDLQDLKEWNKSSMSNVNLNYNR